MRGSRSKTELPCSVCLKYADEVRESALLYLCDLSRNLPIFLCRQCAVFLRNWLHPNKDKL